MPAKTTYLRPKHELLAYVLASGTSFKRAASIVGYQQNYVSTLASSPLFQVRVRQIQEQYTTEALSSLRDRLLAEAQPSLTRLVDLRDRSDDERVSLAAANSILDRTVPRGQVQNREAQNPTLSLSTEALALILEGLAKDEDRSVAEIQAEFFPVSGDHQSESTNGQSDNVDSADSADNHPAGTPHEPACELIPLDEYLNESGSSHESPND